MGPEEK